MVRVTARALLDGEADRGLVFFLTASACFSRSATSVGTFASFVFVTRAMFSSATGAP